MIGYPTRFICGQFNPSAICSKLLHGRITFGNTRSPPFVKISDTLD